MTREEIQRRVDALRARSVHGDHDNEGMHRDEDALYLDVLRAIAGGDVSSARDAAAVALGAAEIDYRRWYS